MNFHRKCRIVGQAALAGTLIVAAQPGAAREWNSNWGLLQKTYNSAPILMPPWSFVSRTGAQCNVGAPQPMANAYSSGNVGFGFLRGRHGGMAGNLPRVVRDYSSGTWSDYITPDGTYVRQQNALYLAPGPANTCAITRFVVPAHQPVGASYTANFAVIPSAAGSPNGLGTGNGVAAFLVLNGVPVGPTVNTATPIITGSNNKTLTLTMSPGDVLDFALNPQGSPDADITKTFFRVIGPEPIDPVPVALGTLPPVPTLGCSSGSTMPSVNLSTGTPQWYANEQTSLVNTAVAPAFNPYWDNVPGASWITPGGLPASFGIYKFTTRVQVDACPADPQAKLKLRFLSSWNSKVSVNGVTLPPRTGTSQIGGMAIYTHDFPVGTTGLQEITFQVRSDLIGQALIFGPPALAANVMVNR